MKENAIRKINTMGKVGNVLIIIAMIFTGLAIFGCLLGGIVLSAIPEDFVKVQANGSAVVTVDVDVIGKSIPEEVKNQIISGKGSGSGKITLDGKVYEFMETTIENNIIKVLADGGVDEFSIRKYAALPFVAFFTVAGTMVVLCFAGALSRAFMKCQSPFEENVIRKMRNLAISMIAWVTVDMVVEGIIQMLEKGNKDFNISIDFGQIFTIMIVFALTFVFKYGAMLQQESDETL